MALLLALGVLAPTASAQAPVYLPVTWTSSTNQLTANTVYAGCVVSGSYVYCTASDTNTVEYAQILPTGGTSTWQTTNSLFTAEYDQSCLVTNAGSGNYIYCIGGEDAIDDAGAQYAQILPNGGTSTWQTTNSLEYAMEEFGQSCVAVSGYIYCMGGTEDGGAADPWVVYAQVLPTGGVSSWTEAPNNLAADVFYQSCVAASNTIYCMGGQPYHSTVQYAQVLPNGGTTGWQTTNSLAYGAWGLSCANVGNTISCMDGVGPSGSSVNTVEYAQILPNGGTSTWQTLSNTLAVGPDFTASCDPASVGSGNYIYCMGGFHNSYEVEYAPVAAFIPTTIALNSNQNPAAYGTSVKFTATVTPAVPNGEKVYFYNGIVNPADLLGTGTLSAGVATFSTSTLLSGTYSILALYGGDSTYAQNYNTISQSVYNTVTSTVVSFTSGSNPSAYGTPLTFKATISPAAAIPNGGYVSFYSGMATTANLIGIAPTSAGIATLTTSILPAGSSTVIAVYPGNSIYVSPSSGTMVSPTVTPLSTSISVALPSGFAPASTGTLQWVSQTTNVLHVAESGQSCLAVGTYIYCLDGSSQTGAVQYAQILPNGGTSAWQATNSLTSSYQDSCVISNGYIYCMGGDNDGNAVQYAQILSGGGTSTWQTSDMLIGDTTEQSCIASGGYIYCMGGEYHSNEVQYAKAVSGGTTAWQATNSLSTLSSGPQSGEYEQSCVVYNGYIYCMGGAYHPVGVQYAQILPGGGTTAWQTTTNLAVGVYESSCVASNGYIYCMGGTADGSTSSNTIQYAQILPNGGTTAWQTANSLSIAEYGDSCIVSNNYVYCMGGANAGHAVQYAPFIVSAGSNPSQYGNPLTFTATVSSSSATPTGTVQFEDNGVNIGSPISLNNGQALLTTGTLLHVGTQYMTANYIPDSQDFTASTSAASPISQTIAPTPTTVTSIMLAPDTDDNMYGSPWTLNAIVSSLGGGTTPTGTVQFQVNGANFGSPVALDSTGLATYSTTNLPAGTPETVTAEYSGDSFYASSSDSAFMYMNPHSMAVTASSNSMTYGGTVPVITPIYSRLINGDSGASVLGATPSCTTNAISSSPAGTYTSYCSGYSSDHAVYPSRINSEFGSNTLFSIYVPPHLQSSSTPLSISAQFDYGNTITSTEDMPSLPQPLAMSDQSDTAVSYTVTFIRARQYPPDGVMPSVAYGGLASSSACGTRPSSISSLLQYCYPVTIQNQQGVATPAGFQQQLSNLPFNALAGNVVVYNGVSGALVPAWIENGTMLWIDLGANTIAAQATVSGKYYIGIGSPGTSFFSTTFANDIGEAPQISPYYAEYDNGNSIFAFYDNFAGTSLRSKWTAVQSTYSVNNGITISPAATENANATIRTSSYLQSTGIVDMLANIPYPSGSQGSEYCVYGVGLNGIHVNGASIGDYCENFPGLLTDSSTAAYMLPFGEGYTMNYNVWYLTNTVTVNPAPLTITASSNSMTYGGSVPAIFPSYSGFVNGDSVSSLTTLPSCGTQATSSSPVGTYASTCTGAADPNYAISYAGNIVTVNQAQTLTGLALSTAPSEYGTSTWANQAANTLAIADNEPGCVTLNGYIYCMGGQGSSNTTFQYAQMLGAGSGTSAWSFWTSPPEMSCGTMPGSIASLITACIPANIVNTQSTPTPTGFQQMFSGTPFNAIAGNVVVYNSVSGALVPCWAESNSVLWCNLGANTIGASSSANGIYYFGLGASGTNFFIPGNDMGEAPQLSAAYGQYDNGANVFLSYFSATSTGGFTVTPNFKLTLVSGVAMPGGSTGNVIKVTGSGMSPSPYYNVPFVYKRGYPAQPSVIESSVELQSDAVSIAQGVAAIVDTTDASDPYISANGIGVTAGWGGNYFSQEYESNSVMSSPLNEQGTPVSSWIYGTVTFAGTSSTSWTGTIAPQLYSDTGGYSGTLTTQPLTTSPTLYLSNFGDAANDAHSYDLYINWERARVYPPGGVMPSVTYGGRGYFFSSAPIVGVYGPSCVASNGYIYCMGGKAGSAPTSTVQYAQVSGGGTAQWTFPTANTLRVAEYGQSCVTAGSYIYCMGGDQQSNAVQYAQMLPGGGTTPWVLQSANALADSVTAPSCVASNGYIYCIGGTQDGSDGTTYVQYAQILPGKGTTRWVSQSANTLSLAVFAHSCVTAGSYIYCMGGSTAAPGYTSTIEYAAVPLGGGPTSAWQATNTLAIGEPSPGCVVSSNTIYCMGGANTVQYAPLIISATAPSQNPSTYGNSLTFDATMSPAVPDGELVTFYDGTTPIGTATTLGDNALFTTSKLSAGTHSDMTANYPGDSNFIGSTSSALSQTIGQAATTLYLASNQVTATYGNTIKFTAQVSPTVPDGENVLFYDGPTLLGNVLTSGSNAVYTTNALSVGPHTITANYVGDTDYTQSSNAITQSVSQVSTTLYLSSNQISSTYGNTVTFTANVYASAGMPTGAVQFEVDGKDSGLPVALVSGQATYSDSSLSVSGSPHSIEAVYSGDSYFASSGNTVSEAINTAQLMITASSNSMTYGGTVPTIAPLYLGFVNGDSASSLTAQPTCNTIATSSSPVGSYTSSCLGAADSNYVISYAVGATSVGPAPLMITASSNSMTYGGTVPTVTASYSGFVNGDTSASLSTQPACASSAVSSSPVGPYTSSCSGAAGSNYNVLYTSGITTVGPAPLTITASSASMTSNSAVPGINALYSGFVNTDSASSLTPQPTCTTTATSNSPVGPYTSSCSGAFDSNYTISYVGGMVTIYPEASGTTPTSVNLVPSQNPSTYGNTISLTASVSPAVPDGENVTFYDGLTQIGNALTSGDNAVISISSLAAGTYTITANYLGDDNYAPSAGTISLTVGSAPLTITASSASMTYGWIVPTITPSYNGFVNGDTASSLSTQPTCVAGATPYSPVGSYTSSCSGAFDSNYYISYVANTVTVSTAPLTITASSNSMTQGGNVPTIMASYSGFVNTDSAASLTTLPTCTTTATSNSPVGMYSSSCSGAVDPNYGISYVNGIVTVNSVSGVITEMNLVSSQNPSTYGNTITFTAQVSPIVPDGENVLFYDGPTLLGNVLTIGSNAIYTTSVLSAGPHTIAADYVGDSTYSGISNTVIQQVTNTVPTISITPASGSIDIGQTATYVAQVPAGAGIGTFTVNLMYDGNVVDTGTIYGITGNSVTLSNVPTVLGPATFNVVAVDTGATPAYVFNSASNTITVIPTMSGSPETAVISVPSNTATGLNYTPTNTVLAIMSSNSILATVTISDATNSYSTTPSASGTTFSKVSVVDFTVANNIPSNVLYMLTMSVPCGSSGNTKPYKLVGGSWGSALPYTSNTAACTITFNVPSDPVIGLFTLTATTAPSTGGNSQSSGGGGGAGGPVGPTLSQFSQNEESCYKISNFTNPNFEVLALNGTSFNIVASAIMSDSVALIINNKVYVLSLGSTTNIYSSSKYNYTVEVAGINYLPILHTATVDVCSESAVPVIKPVVTPSSTTTVPATTTIAQVSTTTVATTSTIPSNSAAAPTPSATPAIMPVTLGIVVAIAIGFAYYNSRRRRGGYAYLPHSKQRKL
jgi:hypothetical protein